MFCDKILTYLDTLASHFNYHIRPKLIPRSPRILLSTFEIYEVWNTWVSSCWFETQYIPCRFAIVWKGMGSCWNGTKNYIQSRSVRVLDLKQVCNLKYGNIVMSLLKPAKVDCVMINIFRINLRLSWQESKIPWFTPFRVGTLATLNDEHENGRVI